MDKVRSCEPLLSHCRSIAASKVQTTITIKANNDIAECVMR